LQHKSIVGITVGVMRHCITGTKHCVSRAQAMNVVITRTAAPLALAYVDRLSRYWWTENGLGCH
jgi:hypothetical protein